MKLNFECRGKQGDKIHVLATAQCRRSLARGPAIACRAFVEKGFLSFGALKQHQARPGPNRLLECFMPKEKNGFPDAAVQDDPAALDPRIPSEIVPAAAIPGQHRSRNR